jgi:hypothetical protein
MGTKVYGLVISMSMILYPSSYWSHRCYCVARKASHVVGRKHQGLARLLLGPWYQDVPKWNEPMKSEWHCFESTSHVKTASSDHKKNTVTDHRLLLPNKMLLALSWYRPNLDSSPKELWSKQLSPTSKQLQEMLLGFLSSIALIIMLVARDPWRHATG